MADIELRHFDDLLNNRLQAQLSTIVGILPDDVAWPEKTYTPVKGTPYLKPEIAARLRTPLGFGADSVQEWTGTYQIGVFVSRDQGTRLQNQIASQLLRAFPRGLAMQTPQGVWLTIMRGTAPVPVSFGDWSNLPLQLDWFAHEPP